MQECLGGTPAGGRQGPGKPMYDFDRLRRKLGPVAAATEGCGHRFRHDECVRPRGRETGGADDEQVGQAFRRRFGWMPRTWQWDSHETPAARFDCGSLSVLQTPDPSARDEGKVDEVLRLLTEAEAGGCRDERRPAAERLGSGSRPDAGPRRRRGGSLRGIQGSVGRSPKELLFLCPAAEAMLGKKDGAKALEFAEPGLKEARAQNNRDAEQQFLEFEPWRGADGSNEATASRERPDGVIIGSLTRRRSPKTRSPHPGGRHGENFPVADPPRAGDAGDEAGQLLRFVVLDPGRDLDFRQERQAVFAADIPSRYPF